MREEEDEVSVTSAAPSRDVLHLSRLILFLFVGRYSIQAVLNIHEGHILFSLLDMTEGGAVGPAVTVTENGDYTLNGFAGSAVSSLNIQVNSFSELVDMIRNAYSGRLVDVLDVRVCS